MMDARAAVLLFTPEASTQDRLDAVARLRARGGIEARALLEQALDQPPAVAAAAASAIAAIDRSLRLWGLAQTVYYGVSLGSVLLLAAAGLAITFGVMGVINMAHGEMVMLGAYTTFVVQGLVLGLAPALSGVSLLFAIPAAFAVSGGLGVVIERTLIRWLYGRPLETLLATFGLSLILQQAVRTIFGANNRAVSTPSWMSGEAHLGGLALTYNRLAIIVFAFLVLAGLAAVMRLTPLGLRMRAVTQNRLMASAMGIRTPHVDALTFGLGSGIAGMAGVALSQIDNVSPNLGQGYIIDSFMVVVFGGVGNLWGTVVGALVLGVVNKFLEPIAGAVLGKIAVLVLLILFIQRKPRGLFPIRGRAVEA
jgi:urea transport system permease protein